MQTLSTFTNWNITSVTQKADGYVNQSYIWNIVDGSTYPFESWEYSETASSTTTSNQIHLLGSNNHIRISGGHLKIYN